MRIHFGLNNCAFEVLHLLFEERWIRILAASIPKLEVLYVELVELDSEVFSHHFLDFRIEILEVSRGEGLSHSHSRLHLLGLDWVELIKAIVILWYSLKHAFFFIFFSIQFNLCFHLLLVAELTDSLLSNILEVGKAHFTANVDGIRKVRVLT